MTTHQAAVCLAKGSPFVIQSRPTPKPGPGELLIQVKSVALNPADAIMRDQGLLVSTYPTVTGFDMAGLVLEVGENVPWDPFDTGRENNDPFFQPGVTRVAAYAASFWRSSCPDYGAFQEKCLVPWQHVIPISNADISWNQAATLPVAAQVPLSAWDAMGIERLDETLSSPLASPTPVSSDLGRKREVLLIWGASSSVGTMGVQSARLLRDNPYSPFAAVYAVASTPNHAYLHSLGADRCFDYKDSGCVDALIGTAKKENLVIRRCFLAMGELAPCQAVLKAFLVDSHGSSQGGVSGVKIASAPRVPPDAEKVPGMEIIFVMPAMSEEQRLAEFRYWMGSWARTNLASGAIRPSPQPKVIGFGLNAVNAGLDELIQGVSCSKLVIEVGK
ncbi:hypothetical protein POX_a00199 [Penicillium oxalicum]|uniref:hypothetical protein n=1 Tax=Penicillium oxalicum TaxID=69781 RepID=UPI0020B87892|nr:hypothetical protein POX_a00199 [Penicillium oxalicum]KAI2793618.1 hypothetical protein POX_a00199 [Penicillium oxalicum]